MADIFREVDEEVRRDKAVEFWKKYQNYLIALAVVIVAASGGWRYYQTHEREAAEAAGARYEAALSLIRDNKPTDADAAFQEIIKQGPAGYAQLARFRAAAEFAATDRAKAVSIYDGLANDPSIGQLMQNVAQLRAALLRLDDADAAELRRRLEPMAAPGQPFRSTAREMLAYAALKANDLEGAGRWFDAILVDQDTPPSIRARAEALIGLVNAGKSN